MVSRNIYAIVDTVAKDILGGAHLHMHDAAAIRMFVDVANAKGTGVNAHPEDYELARLGTINEEGVIIDAEYRPILTGKAWMATFSKEGTDGSSTQGQGANTGRTEVRRNM